MRASVLPSLLVLASVLTLAAPAAVADSWMAPRPLIVSSEDGRWYVIVEPVENLTGASFRLVERAKGKAARAELPIDRGYRTVSGPSPKLEKGDRLVAKGPCGMPWKVRCLNGGKGFLLFETYGAIGSGTVLDLRDGAGKVRFKRTLSDLFVPARWKTFRRTVSSTWWHEAMWIDEVARDIVLVWRGTQGGGVVRVALKSGAHRDGSTKDILARIGRGSASEQIAALEQAVKFKLSGVVDAVGKAFGMSTTPPLARVHFAKFLIEQGDDRGKGYLTAAAGGKDLDVRVYAVQHLGLALGVDALPLLKAAMRDKNQHVRNSAEYALRHMKRAAVPTLIEMIGDETAPETYRAGAATALWNMDADQALDAEAALLKASKSRVKSLAYAAGHALARIRAYRAKHAGK